MRIALDVMGGDHGCVVAIRGAKRALDTDNRITALMLVGQEEKIRAALREAGLVDPRVQIVHASEVLTMKDKPLEGIRKKKDSSLVRAIELVRSKKADAVISAGNTGALVAGSMKLGRVEGVERPAIACRFPSFSQDFIMLDCGANTVAEPSHLAQFAVMGRIYAREILGVEKPRVGVLSNGTEEGKGTELTQAAARFCARLNLDFIGYCEGFDLFNDGVDVVVCDGFTGNIVLKTCESLSKTFSRLLKNEVKANPVRVVGGALARGAFSALKRRLDPEVYGGAAVLGVNGIVIKAHGSSRERAFASAVRVATDEFGRGLKQMIAADIQQANQQIAALTAGATGT
ncbi:MAG TPA: phosphate acyltransferase PlsX [Verrucomicrobiota bacterium]|nr:phosphate acyltransferase PlsX [Verrucomicrobiota bacterium]HNT14499.1 phosphate acyltransferase PlsX [Verrucomicrobiota bacterium]